MSVTGVPYAFDWYHSIGCGMTPVTPVCTGLTCSIPLGYPEECLTYMGRYWHEIAPGLLYVNVKQFIIETTCLPDFIFSDGFENGTTNQWSNVVPN